MNNVIYKATFPNGKVYIGKTKNFEDRKNKHSYSYRYYKTKMSNAILKYGFESIKWDILFSNSDSNIINEKEKEFIVLYDSIESGYNISTGGDGGDTISKNGNKNLIMAKQLKSKGINTYVIIDIVNTELIINDYINNNLSIRKISNKYNIIVALN